MTNNNKSDPAIPTLDDLVLVDEIARDKAEPASARTKSGTPGASPETAGKSLPRDNPFLPYEHLEQLARERAEFQKQFVQFSLAQQSRQTSGNTAAGDGSHQASLDLLARQLTDRVLTEMRPQIEKRMRELIQEHQADLSQNSK